MSAERGWPGAKRLAAVLCVLSLGGCASERVREPAVPPAATPLYVVRPGDTVYSIARRHGLEVRDLARWNGLSADYTIGVGQRLLLGPPPAGSPSPSPSPSPAAAATTAVPPAFGWPVAGESVGILRRPAGGFGLAIAAGTGTPVRAAAAGRVAYVGRGLRAYGLLVIVRHDEHYLSAYGHLQEATVSDGDAVAAGAVIGSVGRTPEGEARLYFEIRLEGRPVDPTTLLPRRAP